jgi:hypothetical protein
MNKRARKLRQYFPKASESTRLVIMGRSQRLIIGAAPLQLTEYDVGDGESMYAAYSEETDTIYIRLIELSFFSKKKE